MSAVTIKGEPAKSRANQQHAGPQGTQVFSREQIAELLENETREFDDGERASLTLLSGTGDDPAAAQTFALTADRITVGRSAVCDICVEEPSMSSEHARLVRSEDAWRIINLLSTNGVFVNGDKVFSHRLADGDEIRLGRTRLRFNDPVQRRSRRSASGGRASLVQWLPWLLVPVTLAALAYWLIA
ncbi:MAG: FHA domain-containing protein [Wenzhouxiangellaceae bacterium]|nr:FHA domain-containing protein [Wenzhouxiangellaceae bacterium]